MLQPLPTILGIPVEEGDILLTPPIGSPIGTLPGIAVAAKSLGLATVRSGAAAVFGDDLDALDQFFHPDELLIISEPNGLLLAELGMFGLAFLRVRRRRE